MKYPKNKQKGKEEQKMRYLKSEWFKVVALAVTFCFLSQGAGWAAVVAPAGGGKDPGRIDSAYSLEQSKKMMAEDAKKAGNGNKQNNTAVASKTAQTQAAKAPQQATDPKAPAMAKGKEVASGGQKMASAGNYSNWANENGIENNSGGPIILDPEGEYLPVSDPFNLCPDDAIFMINPATGEIVGANASAKRFLDRMEEADAIANLAITAVTVFSAGSGYLKKPGAVKGNTTINTGRTTGMIEKVWNWVEVGGKKIITSLERTFKPEGRDKYVKIGNTTYFPENKSTPLERARAMSVERAYKLVADRLALPTNTVVDYKNRIIWIDQGYLKIDVRLGIDDAASRLKALRASAEKIKFEVRISPMSREVRKAKPQAEP